MRPSVAIWVLAMYSEVSDSFFFFGFRLYFAPLFLLFGPFKNRKKPHNPA
ncbi:hypothetical protein HanIR_Chr01g0020421 [Helianthus annuus]|nr:hypothetical protein HanIR_Chr01g0020421 [Helianthus annuus]